MVQYSTDPIGDRKEIPGVARLLGYAGLLPFLLTAALMWFATDAGIAATAHKMLIAYGAIILSFLGGIRWGLCIGPARRTRPESRTGSECPAVSCRLGSVPAGTDPRARHSPDRFCRAVPVGRHERRTGSVAPLVQHTPASTHRRCRDLPPGRNCKTDCGMTFRLPRAGDGRSPDKRPRARSSRR